MEILVVFFLSYVLQHLQKSLPAKRKTSVTLGVVALFAAARVAWTVLSFPESLYVAAAGLRRDMSCEEIKNLYQEAKDARDPDSFSDDVPFQSQFEVLSNPLTRVRYEYYARSEEDAALKDLFASLPFYVGGLLLAYGLTCSKATIFAGKWGIVLLALLSSVEWRMKSVLPQQPDYSSLRLTMHEQMEVVKALFYPLLLLLYLFSSTRFRERLVRKQGEGNRLIGELNANREVLEELKKRKEITEEELQRAVELNKQRAEELKTSLMKQEKQGHWRKWLTNLAIIGVAIYLLKSSESTPEPPQGRPQYWKSNS